MATGGLSIQVHTDGLLVFLKPVRLADAIRKPPLRPKTRTVWIGRLARIERAIDALSGQRPAQGVSFRADIFCTKYGRAGELVCLSVG